MKTHLVGIKGRQGNVHAASKRLLGVVLSLAALPCLLSAQTLQHRYSFVSDASDSVGGPAWAGTLVAPGAGSPAMIANGLSLPGGGTAGYSGYLSLPNGILTSTTNLTIECWVTQNAANEWATIWCFDNSTAQNFQLCPDPGRDNGDLIVDINPSSDEDDLFTPFAVTNAAEEYITVTVNSSTLTENLYYNGAFGGVMSLPNSSYVPGTFGGANGTDQNWLGRDTYNDTQFQGTIYELRIWNGVVPERYIQASALLGPGTVLTALTPTSVTLTAGTNMVLTGTEAATVTVQLAATGTTNLLATSDATNWVSSNPNVLHVTSSGVITGVGLGTATVSATIAGVTATSLSITVTPQALAHRYSFVTDASDSVGGANGTIVAPANTNGQPATISNGLSLPGNRNGGFGYSGYVSFPPGLLTNTPSLTVECWVTQNQANSWAEIWDFANNGSQNFGLIPYPQNNGDNMAVAFTPNGNEQDLDTATSFPNGSEQYVAVTFNNSTAVGSLYLNGALDATRTFPGTAYFPGTLNLPTSSYGPWSIGGAAGTAQDMLGNDTYGDWQFSGTIYEFRIWNGVVTPVYFAVSAAAGPTIVITNTTPTSLAIGLSTTSMIGAATQQATVTGNFNQVSAVTLTSVATNWVSSNPAVLTVNQSGLITAVSGGTATVSATVNGVTATSATISVANTSPTFSQKPANLILAVNDTATFTAVALGGGLNYQWDFNGNPISGATSATLILTNLSLTNAGTYTVLISNNLGNTNATATLAVAQAILQHRYSFVSDASDSVGGANGTIVAPKTGSAATISNGLILPGNTSGGFGYSGYVSLPNGLLTNTTSLTIETWVTQNSQNNWATIWDFADNGNINFELCPYNNNFRDSSQMFSAFTPDSPAGLGEDDLNSDVTFPNGSEQYVTLTVNGSTLVGNLYTNGILVGTVTLPSTSYLPYNIGSLPGQTRQATIQDMLGNDTFGDDQFSGTIYEFRIWDGAVTPLYLAVASAAGSSVVVTNLTPISINITVTNDTMIQGQSQPAGVTGNFTEANGVILNGLATNWVSSNTGVLTVNSNGLITAVGTGSATISATVAGFTGTSASIAVPASLAVITQQPEASDTFLQGATLTASVSNIGTPPFTYRWYFNGGATPISVSASPVLTIPDVQSGNAGTYTVVISNVVGNVTSSNLLVSVITPTPYEQTVQQYGPLAYWPLQETSGSIAYDVIGGDNGVYTNFPTIQFSAFTLAQAGPSQTFFGGSSYGVLFQQAIADIPEGQLNITGPITVTAWVQESVAVSFASIVGHGDDSWRITLTENGDPNGGLPGGNDGNAAGDATAPTTNSINDSSWHMVAYTYSGNPSQANNGALYLDGAPVANNSITAAPAGDNLDVWIGGSPDYGTNRIMQYAAIAHVAVFNQSFTPAQVSGLYNGTFVLGPQTLHIAQTGSAVVLNWQTGTLLQSTNVLGPWTTNSVATPPYTVPATNKDAFFRLLVNP